MNTRPLFAEIGAAERDRSFLMLKFLQYRFFCSRTAAVRVCSVYYAI